MSYQLTDHLAQRRRIGDPARAGTDFDRIIREILPHGGSGQSLWFGPEGAEPQLRVDIDVDLDRAALTWLPDRTIAVEREPGPPLTVLWSVDEPLVTVPGAVARVGVATARRAVVEYVATGRRPGGVGWTAPGP